MEKKRLTSEMDNVTTQVVATLEQDKRINKVLCVISLVFVGITHHLGVCQSGAWLCLGIACCANLYLSKSCIKYKKEIEESEKYKMR